MASPINWDDPCQRAEALRDAYYRLLSGTLESEIEYMGNGVTRRARFSQTNLSELQSAIRLAEAECSQVLGAPGRARVRTIRLATSKGL